MSETAHAEDFGDIVQLSLQDPSDVALQRVRPEDPRELAFRARMVAYYLLEAIHTFISWYRPGELGLAENSRLARWYQRLRPWLKALEDFNPGYGNDSFLFWPFRSVADLRSSKSLKK